MPPTTHQTPASDPQTNHQTSRANSSSSCHTGDSAPRRVKNYKLGSARPISGTLVASSTTSDKTGKIVHVLGRIGSVGSNLNDFNTTGSGKSVML